eukprot:365793-Chlamydomonas_euryale.AAC.4
MRERCRQAPMRPPCVGCGARHGALCRTAVVQPPCVGCGARHGALCGRAAMQPPGASAGHGMEQRVEGAKQL